MRRQEWAELFVAIYFLVDSISVVHKWKIHKEHTSLMGIALFVGVVSYLHASNDCWKEWRRHGFEQVVQNPNAVDAERDMIYDSFMLI